MKTFEKNGIYVIPGPHVIKTFRFNTGVMVHNHATYDSQGYGSLHGKTEVAQFAEKARKATKEEMRKHIEVEHKHGFIISRVKDLDEVNHRSGSATYFMPGMQCIGDHIFEKIIKLGITHYRKLDY